MSENNADIIVIGAGIAGASVAAELAKDADVLLLEMESQPGYHTTGRSAAMFAPNYGPEPIRALTRASADFFKAPPEGFCENPMLSQRDVVMVAREDQAEALDEHLKICGGPDVSRLDQAKVEEYLPLLRKGYALGAALDQGGSDIDVAALHQGFLNQFRARGGRLVNKSEVQELRRDGDKWTATTSKEEFAAPILVNAAGAWAGKIGEMAAAEDIGLIPKQRTAVIIAAPEGTDVDVMPLVVDIEEQFYMKPDAGRLLISPADETSVAPQDAQPDEMDVAICVDRIETVFDLSVRRIENKWAGLRSFVADKSPVAGFSDRAEGFFWLAGQGGYGIQSAPALARFAAALIQGKPVPQDILDEGFDPASVAPARLV